MPTTLVLVHGGSVTSCMWDPLLPHLRTPARTVDLPGRRYQPADLGQVRRADWERSLAAQVRSFGPGPFTLVGHSSGGYVVPGAAALLPAGTVDGLVFVSATCPPERQRPVDAMNPELQALTLAHEDNLRARAGGKTLAGLRPGEPDIKTSLQVEEVAPTMGLEAPLQFFEPMTWIGVPDVPRYYVRALRDRVVPPDHALLMAANARAQVIDIDASHDVARSNPVALAALLDQLAAAGVEGI